MKEVYGIARMPVTLPLPINKSLHGSDALIISVVPLVLTANSDNNYIQWNLTNLDIP